MTSAIGKVLRRSSRIYIFYIKHFLLDPSCLGLYSWINLVSTTNCDCVDSEITPERFLGPILCASSQSLLPALHIGLIRCINKDVTRKQLIDDVRILRPNYKLPKPWHALLFAALHPKEQRKRPIIFFHRPVEVEGERMIIVLDGGLEWRHIDLEPVGDSKALWDKCYRFAFVVED